MDGSVYDIRDEQDHPPWQEDNWLQGTASPGLAAGTFASPGEEIGHLAVCRSAAAESAAVWAAVAHIHATVALAAATALGTTAVEGRTWANVAGTKFSADGPGRSTFL